MSNETKVFTVTVITEDMEGVVTPVHYDYSQDQANDAMQKWHHESEYARSVIGNTLRYFCAYISNQWGGVEVKDEYTMPENQIVPEEPTEES